MSSGVGKERRQSRADASHAPPNQEMGSEYKYKYKRRDTDNKREKEKENPPPLKKERGNGVIEGRSSRGLGLRNNNSSASKSNTSAMPLKHTIRSGVRNAGRSEEPRQAAKEREEAQSLILRWSTSSLPSSTNNANGKPSSSVACIISDLQRQRQQIERETEGRTRQVLQNDICVKQDDETKIKPSSPKPPPPLTNQIKKKTQVKDGEDNVKGSGEVRVEVNESFPRKIHERLASLEKRVSRISSELRRTKEMLDANNTHKSITMLSDIDLKISCIEKAMDADNFVGKDSEEDGSLIHIPPKSDDPTKRSSGSHEKEENLQESSLSLKHHQELEDRLFPHQKLLRSRASCQLTALKPKSENLCQNSSSSDFHVQDFSEKELLSPIDEDPVAAEFLSALNHKYSVLSKDSTNNLISSRTDEINQESALPISEMNENDHSRTVSRDGESVEGIDPDCKEPLLACDETMEYDDKENNQPYACNAEEIEEASLDRLNQFGHKTYTAGWFV